MAVKSIKITNRDLKNHEACRSQIKLFDQIFPDGATYPDDVSKAAKAGLDAGWFLSEFGLSGMFVWKAHGRWGDFRTKFNVGKEAKGTYEIEFYKDGIYFFGIHFVNAKATKHISIYKYGKFLSVKHKVGKEHIDLLTRCIKDQSGEKDLLKMAKEIMARDRKKKSSRRRLWLSQPSIEKKGTQTNGG